ncbi:MAG: HAMP domain-containing protein [Verrucomicrobiota bacterium]|nr:HAMP domain-containing protein [Verrucomicrobiota bacterium]
MKKTPAPVSDLNKKASNPVASVSATPKQRRLLKNPTTEIVPSRGHANGQSGEIDLLVLLDCLRSLDHGNFASRLPAHWTGVGGRISDAFNAVVEKNQALTRELERLGRLVGKEGKVTHRATLPSSSGGWQECLNSVNSLISDLAQPTQEASRVIGAVAKGDLSQKMSLEIEGRPLQGEFLKTATVVNTMVDQLNGFASEVTRVAREVGTEGKLGGQAVVKGVAGIWQDLTESVNLMASNLTSQVRNIATVTTAVAKGDLTKKITVDVKGEILDLKNTINTMVDQLRSFASEVTRVAREVGTEGKLGGQAKVEGVSGTWKDLTDNVNFMASNLTNQVRNIAAVTTAVANGDLSKKIAVNVQGEILELKNTINTMVDQLRSFASEVTRVAREVGSEGKLGGQARVEGVTGAWKDLTDSVNSMASNLTSQVRNIADVTTAVARGDLSKKITVNVQGEILELKNTINTMVDQLSSFAAEVTRVAREVSMEGKLGGQADVKGVAGTWKDLTDSVNSMASNLTLQVRNIAEVTTAVANGDLSKKVTVDVKGEVLELKNTVNTMVDQLRSFASEVTRVAREVGSEGKLGGQADVKGVAGTWKDLTDSVNSMASNLTLQVRNIAEVTTAVANGNLSKKVTVDVKGEVLELKNTVNTMVDQLRSFASEVTRVAREVGTEGKLGGQARVEGVSGTWKDLTDSVNSMASNLTSQVRNIAEVTTAVANGNLSKKISVDVKGEILELKNTVNTMVDQLSSFASEVTRVAREVGTEGKLGGQAKVEGVTGAWKDLTDNVNFMASNLTNQVRGIAKVVTAVARGDLKRKLLVEAKGEIAELADTINNMTDTLATFAEQVTTVAREVGVEGKLGGQADVPGAAGTWRDLTDNVNQLAANLTTQVRAIADVGTAVTKGDLTQTIQVKARGEVASLKDNINEMILNLRETTLKNSEQDWLKTNLAKFTRMLQGQKDLLTVGRLILSELARVVNAQHGVFYIMDNPKNEGPILNLLTSYAYRERKSLGTSFRLGESLVGQAAFEKERILLTNVPSDYVLVNSGLGEAPPLNIIVLPVVFEGSVKAVIELASFEKFSPTHQAFLDQLIESIGIVLNTIEANTLTEALLKQSQTLAAELQNGQLELQKTNHELEEKARLLVEQNAEVERKNQEVEQARQALEEKARQLSLTSKYKSEFLANMSHELRTPLNSLLILADQLASNSDGNLSGKQVEFSRTICASGRDLLRLINDILDLSKIESGTVSVDVSECYFEDLQQNLGRTFKHIADSKDIDFNIRVNDGMVPVLFTDPQRLEQVLKNLLSNAFKFTESGSVEVKIFEAQSGWSPGIPTLDKAKSVIGISVTDTGIGILGDKQKTVFEAFQQADGSTSRKYGGTGLGLAISREISRLLGGDIQLVSELGEGSCFTLYLPQTFVSPKTLALSALADRSASGSTTILAPMTFAQPREVENIEKIASENLHDDDRSRIRPDDKVLLIVEDDINFVHIIQDVARAAGFKTIIATRGTTALLLMSEYSVSAMTLDISLPDMDGWKILERVKNNLLTRHIAVEIISMDEEPERSWKQGALGYTMKPISHDTLKEVVNRLKNFVERKQKRLLVIEDEEIQRKNIVDLVGNNDVVTWEAWSGAHALELLGQEKFDCIVLDLVLPDMPGVQLIEEIKKNPAHERIPVIVYTAKSPSPEEEARLIVMAQSIIVKDVRSPERLFDQTALWLHRNSATLPEEKRQILSKLYQNDGVLNGKKVLLVDDDIRNVFAMTSLLERFGMDVATAETGFQALDVLKDRMDIEVVLMDIMLPEMDGYETMKHIREMETYKSVPIVALTAKAMKGDREKCLHAGASDYISKPVDTDRLLSVLKMWLYR